MLLMLFVRGLPGSYCFCDDYKMQSVTTSDHTALELERYLLI